MAISEEGSFTGAAERLVVAQPAVSHQVARLERRLGYRLFERTSRGAVPTEACARLLAPARSALEALAEVDALARRRASTRPAVTLGAGFGVDAAVVTEAARLALDHGLRLTLIRAGSRELSQRLLDGELDLGLLSASVHRLDQGLRARWLPPVRVVGVVARADPLGDRVPLSEVLARPVLLLGPRSGLRDTVRRVAGEHALDVLAEVDDPGLLLDLAASGAAVALVPRSLAEPATARPELRVVELTGSPLQHHPALVWAGRTRSATAVIRYRDALEAALTG